jgi:hypothetical protein
MTMQEKSHTWIYVTIVVVIVALMIAGVALHREQKQTAEAQAKAKEFVAALKDNGLPAPSEAAAARLFGTDGGQVMGMPDEELYQAEYSWLHGTSGAAGRPVILSPDFIKAAWIFVSVYAPEKMDEFIDWTNGLKLDETID